MRDIKQCHPRLQKLADELVTACERKGLKIKITECLRTAAEQDSLYAQGRTKPGNRVTNARGSSYSSMHQWGVAFDFCRNDGKGAFNDDDGFFKKVGIIGQTLGLEWGGSWKSIKDKPHFQLPDWGSTATKLKRTYGTPERFFSTWGNASSKKKSTAPKQSETPKKYYMKYTGKTGSITVALSSFGIDSSFAFRTKIAKANGIANYKGTAAQNLKLLELFKSGKLVKP